MWRRNGSWRPRTWNTWRIGSGRVCGSGRGVRSNSSQRRIGRRRNRRRGRHAISGGGRVWDPLEAITCAVGRHKNASICELSRQVKSCRIETGLQKVGKGNGSLVADRRKAGSRGTTPGWHYGRRRASPISSTGHDGVALASRKGGLTRRMCAFPCLSARAYVRVVMVGGRTGVKRAWTGAQQGAPDLVESQVEN